MSTDKKKQGYIKLYRDVRDHWIWNDRPFSRGQAWIDLIMLVNHEDRKFMFMGSLTTVKKGSKITSLRQLSERWGWSKDKVAHFLDVLEEDGMLTQLRDSKKTLISVINYDFYQDRDDSKKTPKRQSKDTEKTQTGRSSDADRNKQDIKEDIKEDIKKKEAPPPDDDDIVTDFKKFCEEDDDDDW